jgi:predicted nucleotidyltransferase
MRQLLDALQVYQPERVYVFGSWARGEADELSDLDIVVIKRTTVSFFERLREVSRLLPAGTGAVDILVYTPEEFAAMLQAGNAFAEMITEEARLLYVQQTES